MWHPNVEKGNLKIVRINDRVWEHLLPAGNWWDRRQKKITIKAELSNFRFAQPSHGMPQAVILFLTYLFISVITATFFLSISSRILIKT